MVTDRFTPPVEFRFSVTFKGLSPPVDDVAFAEVSGLDATIEPAPLREGGENRFIHNLPGKVKHSNLKLKRCITTTTSGLALWCKSVLESGFEQPIKPSDLVIKLLDVDDKPIAIWSVTDAFPIRWEIGEFDAMQHELAMESIELSYRTSARTL